jgi:hypothetical protein
VKEEIIYKLEGGMSGEIRGKLRSEGRERRREERLQGGNEERGLARVTRGESPKRCKINYTSCKVM